VCACVVLLDIGEPSIYAKHLVISHVNALEGWGSGFEARSANTVGVTLLLF
jgi:hypothetical protein